MNTMSDDPRLLITYKWVKRGEDMKCEITPNRDGFGLDVKTLCMELYDEVHGWWMRNGEMGVISDVTFEYDRKYNRKDVVKVHFKRNRLNAGAIVFKMTFSLNVDTQVVHVDRPDWDSPHDFPRRDLTRTLQALCVLEAL